MSHLAVDPNVPATLFDNSVYGSESQPGALAHIFGGEEGLENPGAGDLIHADTVIADGEHHVAACLHGRVFPDKRLIEIEDCGLDNQFPATWHGVARVHRQVHHDLVELPGIRLHDGSG